MEAVHEGLHPDDAAGHAVVDHLRRLGRVARGRLLAEHVLGGVGGAHRPFRMQVIRERDVDGLDVGRGEQLFVRARADAVEPGLGDEVGGAPRLAADRDELDPVCAEDCRDHDLAGDVRGAEDSDAEAGHQGSLCVHVRLEVAFSAHLRWCSSAHSSSTQPRVIPLNEGRVFGWTSDRYRWPRKRKNDTYISQSWMRIVSAKRNRVLRSPYQSSAPVTANRTPNEAVAIALSFCPAFSRPCGGWRRLSQSRSSRSQTSISRIVARRLRLSPTATLTRRAPIQASADRKS